MEVSAQVELSHELMEIANERQPTARHTKVIVIYLRSELPLLISIVSLQIRMLSAFRGQLQSSLLFTAVHCSFKLYFKFEKYSQAL